MRYAARLTVTVDVEVHACGPGDAAQAAKVAGVEIRNWVDRLDLTDCDKHMLALHDAGAVAWVAGVDITEPTEVTR